MSAMAEVRYLVNPSPQARQVDVKFDSESKVLWAVMNPRPRPCFNPQLLLELGNYISSITGNKGRAEEQGRLIEIEYAVIASGTAGIFNLGGDLALFRDAIVRRDRYALMSYGTQCVENLLPWTNNCYLPLTTISLVQGDALGGGFECALASSVLIAEESSRMGFPEILFNLFPGMGAYTFLSRKVGRRLTEELITSGTTYTGRELYELGVVDVLAEDGGGEASLHAFVRKHSKSGNARRALERVRNETNPVTRDELMKVVSIWADAALALTDRDIRMMDRLVRAQNKANPAFDGEKSRCAISPLQRMAVN